MCMCTFFDKSNEMKQMKTRSLCVTEFLYSSSHLSRLWDKSVKLYPRQRERERENPSSTLPTAREVITVFPQSKPPILIDAVQLILPLCPSEVSERWGGETLEGEHICHLSMTHKTRGPSGNQLLPHMYLLIWRPLPAQLLVKGGGGSQERQPKLTLDIQYGQDLNWPEPSLESNFLFPKLPQECRAWNEVEGEHICVCVRMHSWHYRCSMFSGLMVTSSL